MMKWVQSLNKKQTTFELLFNVNVDSKIEKKENKDSLTYLSWAHAWIELNKAVEGATYKVYENEQGFPFFNSSLGIMVKVGVTVNEKEHVVFLPVMNGANKAMKESAYTYEVNDKYKGGKIQKTVESADMMDINRTIQRALTKSIAMHGLGLYIYTGEVFSQSTGEDHTQHNKSIDQRLEDVVGPDSRYEPEIKLATQKQLDLLAKLNVAAPKGLTMAAASKLISDNK